MTSVNYLQLLNMIVQRCFSECVWNAFEHLMLNFALQNRLWFWLQEWHFQYWYVVFWIQLWFKNFNLIKSAFTTFDATAAAAAAAAFAVALAVASVSAVDFIWFQSCRGFQDLSGRRSIEWEKRRNPRFVYTREGKRSWSEKLLKEVRKRTWQTRIFLQVLRNALILGISKRRKGGELSGKKLLVRQRKKRSW